MDMIRSALGYETQAHADKQTTSDQLGEIASGNTDTSSSVPHGGAAPQHTSGNTNSGTEPISGQLGSGTAGEPYDGGNEEGLSGGHAVNNPSSTGTSGLASELTGHSSRGTGYEGTSGIGGSNTSGQGNNSTLSGLASSLTGNSSNSSGQGNNSTLSGIASGLTGNSSNTSGYGNNSSTTGSGLTGTSGLSDNTSHTGHRNTTGHGNESALPGVASALTGQSNRGQDYENTSGLGDNTSRTGHGNDSTLSGVASGLTGQSNRGQGYENTSGLGDNTSHTGHHNTTGRGNESTLSGVATGVASGLIGHSNRGQGYENTSGLGNNSAPTVGSGNYDNTSSGYSGSSGPNPDVAGYESTSGFGNNTGYDQSTSRGLGAVSEQQANHYTSTAVAGKLPSALGINAVHQVGGERDSNIHHGNHGRESNLGQGFEQGNTHEHGNTHGKNDGAIHQDTSSGYGRSLLGSDRGAGTTGDRYLFNEHTAPGRGGRNHGIVDDFTDANIHHEGAGGISEGLGSDAHAGRAIAGAANTDLSSPNTGSHSGLESNKSNERARKPGFGRVGSNVGTGNYGLNSGSSGAPRESIGQKLENKAERYAPAAGLAGAGAAAHHHNSGTEPLSGQRGSGVAGEPYDQGNKYDGTGVTGRERLERKAEEFAPAVGAAGAAGYGANHSHSGTGSGYGNDGMSEATSGVSGMNLAGGQRGTDHQGAYGNSSNTVITPEGLPYPGRNQNTQGTGLSNSSDNFSKSQDAGLTGAGLVGAGDAATSGHHHHHHHDNSIGAGLEQRFAGAPPDDDCEGAHHSSHPTGEAAHVDGTHKPTFLDYQNDEFGIPVARDDEATGTGRTDRV